MRTKETYRIVQADDGPRWIAFRRDLCKVQLVYVGHAHTREMVREIVEYDRRSRANPQIVAGGNRD
jgi:hypothetical protein